VTCVIYLEQFRIFLYCCPDDDDQSITSDLEIPILKLAEDSEFPPIVQATKGDHMWNLAVEKVKSLISAASKLKYTIEKSETVPASLYDTKLPKAGSVAKSNVLISCAQYEILVNGYNQIGEFVKDIAALKTLFELPTKSQQFKQGQETEPQIAEESQSKSSMNPMIDSLCWLQQYMLDEASEFSLSVKKDSSSSLQAGVQVTDEEDIVKDFREGTEKLLENILLVMQEAYKKFNEKSNEPDEDTEICKEKDGMKQNKDVEYIDEEENKSEDGHFKVVESLSTTLSMLQISQVNEQFHGLIQRLIAILDAEQVQQGNICKR